MAIDKIQSESINLADNYAFTGTVTGAGGVNSEMFLAVNSAAQSFAHNTNAKVQFNSEVFDTGNNYDPTTNYRYVVPSDGKYFISAQIRMNGGGNTLTLGLFQLYLNGSSKVSSYWNTNDGEAAMVNNISIILDLSANDYLEMYYQNNNNPNASTMAYSSTTYNNWFLAYKMNT
jgi:hypothetical protein